MGAMLGICIAIFFAGRLSVSKHHLPKTIPAQVPVEHGDHTLLKRRTRIEEPETPDESSGSGSDDMWANAHRRGEKDIKRLKKLSPAEAKTWYEAYDLKRGCTEEFRIVDDTVAGYFEQRYGFKWNYK